MAERLAAAALVLAVLAAFTQSRQRQQTPVSPQRIIGTAPSNVAIEVTVSPEARLSASMVGAMPDPVPCGTPTSLRVRVVNRGFVTTPLRALLVGGPASGVTFGAERLTGAAEEIHTLGITLLKPGPSDVTLAFEASKELADLAGRERVYLILDCE